MRSCWCAIANPTAHIHILNRWLRIHLFGRREVGEGAKPRYHVIYKGRENRLACGICSVWNCLHCMFGVFIVDLNIV